MARSFNFVALDPRVTPGEMNELAKSYLYHQYSRELLEESRRMEDRLTAYAMVKEALRYAQATLAADRGIHLADHQLYVLVLEPYVSVRIFADGRRQHVRS